jgi:hypothetical protein
MPSFEEFSYFGLFPEPAIKEEVLFFGNFAEDIRVSTSTLNIPETSVPIWWLLYKVRFKAEYEISTTRGTNTITYSDSFNVEFLVNPTSPNERYCHDNLLVGNGYFIEAPNNDNEFRYGKYFAVEPFQCDNIHALFMVQGDEVFESTDLDWYITSGPRFPYDSDQWSNVSTEEIEVNLPDGTTITLNQYIDFGDAGYGSDASATGSITDVEFEWYTLE